MKKIGYITGEDLQHDLGCVWKTEDDGIGYHPVIHDTIHEAYIEVADNLMDKLRQFIDGERELDETPFEADEVLMIEWSDDDVLTVKTLEGATLYDITLEKYQSEL